VMMRSLSTSALGQPSETKLTFGARAAGRPAFGFSMRQGLAEHGRGRKRLARAGDYGQKWRRRSLPIEGTPRREAPARASPGPALPSAQVSSGGAFGERH
jgi:hypothetical protein